MNDPVDLGAERLRRLGAAPEPAGMALSKSDRRLIERMRAGGVEVTPATFKFARTTAARFDQINRASAARRGHALRRIMAAINGELGPEEERLAGIRAVVAEELGRGLFCSKK